MKVVDLFENDTPYAAARALHDEFKEIALKYGLRFSAGQAMPAFNKGGVWYATRQPSYKMFTLELWIERRGR